MVSVVSPSEILVTWDPVPPIDQNGIITMYEVLYQPLETFSGAIGPVVEDVMPPNISVILAQLEENVFYNISIRAFTEVGPSDYTTALLERTPEDGKYLVFYMVEPPHGGHIWDLFFSSSFLRDCSLSEISVFSTLKNCPMFGCPLIGASFIEYFSVDFRIFPTQFLHYLIPDFNFSSIQGTNYH